MIRVNKNKKLTKTASKKVVELFGNDSYYKENGNVSYEFWDGKKFIGVVLGEDFEDFIYIDILLINEKYRGNGYGNYVIDYLKTLYRNIELESIPDSFSFWQ